MESHLDDLTGRWCIHSSENLDAFLKMQRVPWLQRVLMRTTPVCNDIRRAPDGVTITVEVPGSTKMYHCRTDGTDYSVESMQGLPTVDDGPLQTARSVWQGSTLVTTTATAAAAAADRKTIRTERYIQRGSGESEMIVRHVVLCDDGDEVIATKRIFRRCDQTAPT